MSALLERIKQAHPSAAFVEVGKACPVADVGVSYVDKLSVVQTAYVLSRSQLYVGPDSGLAHLAMAVGTPAVVLYGPVNPKRAFGPRECLHAVTSPAECRGCWTEGRMQTPGQCPLGIRDDEPAAYPCMQQLTPDFVLEAMQQGQVFAGWKEES